MKNTAIAVSGDVSNRALAKRPMSRALLSGVPRPINAGVAATATSRLMAGMSESSAAQVPIRPTMAHVSHMRTPPPMTVSLTRVKPTRAPNSAFAPGEYINSLNTSLSALEPTMRAEIRAALPRALAASPSTADPLTDAQIDTALETLCQRIKETPLHIGFVCDKKYFDAQGQFWPSGRYYNRPLWYRQKGYQIPHPRPFELTDVKPEHQPIYGALNLGMTGHGGWGASCFVLKPSACKTVELRSRDTGEPDGIGAFALTATREKPLPLVADWIRMGALKKMWSGMAGETREQFFIPPSMNVEAAIYTEQGYIPAEDVALIMLSKQEAAKNGVDLGPVMAAGRAHGIPVICHDGQDGKIPFDQLPEYQQVLTEYAAAAAEN